MNPLEPLTCPHCGVSLNNFMDATQCPRCHKDLSAAPTVQPSECPQCGSKQVVTGNMYGGRGNVVFAPEGLRTWRPFSAGVGYKPSFQACLDCGLFSGELSPGELKAYIRKYGTEETRNRFQLDTEDAPNPASVDASEDEGPAPPKPSPD